MRLCEFIRTHREAILHEWETETRERAPVTAQLDRPALIDHVPRLLDDFVAIMQTFGERPSIQAMADVHADSHALQRIDQGIPLAQVVRELAVLRSCVLRMCRNCEPSPSLEETEMWTSVVDQAIERAVDRYSARRAQLLEAFEQIADAAFDVPDLDAFLDRLLRVFVRAAPSIDSVTILLREGNRLRTRASLGLEEEVRAGFSVEIGEGFSGMVAATRKAQLLHDAWRDPLVLSPAIRDRKTCALYGVPLLDGETVVGVAHIGTRDANDIPAPEKRIFTALAQRSTSAIIKHGLRAEARRRVAELVAVVEAIPNAVFIGDAERITLANRAALDLLGVADREVSRETVLAAAFRLGMRDAITGEPITLDAIPYARALHGEERIVQDIVVRDPSSGEDRILRANGGPIREEGENRGAVVVLSDVTELHRAMGELRRTADFRERFLGIVSHDLRNPLNAISMSASVLLKSPDLPPSLAKPAGRILAHVDRMASMVSDLLDFTRGRLGGGIPLKIAPASLEQVARRAIDEIEQVYPLRRIVFESHGNVVGKWDVERLAQVVTNLLSNAIQYGAPEEPIRVAVEGSPGKASLLVHNKGSAIPPEDLPHLFDPFRRAKGMGNDGSLGGLGLGLFIAAEIVRGHGGRIVATSDEGGTTFTVTLPLVSPSQS